MERNNKKKKFSGQMLFFIFLMGSSIATIAYLPRLTIPLGLSYVISLILSPCIPILMRIGISKTNASLLILVGLISLSVIPIVKLGPSVSEQVKNVQYYLPKIEKYITTEYLKLTSLVEETVGIEISEDHVANALTFGKDAIQNFLLNIPKLLASVVEWFFLIPLFVFFLLKDGGNFKIIMLRVTPNSIFERFYYVTHQFHKQIGDYIFAKFIEASIVCIIITTGLLIMDIRFSLLLGLLAGATNIIPYLGPLLGMAPALIFGLVEYGMGTTFGAIAILYSIANAIDIAIVFPILVSKIVNLHPIIVVASVIFGSQALGVIGMVISIPFAAALKLILTEIYNEVHPSGAK